jgi:hypothetical protein
MPPLFALQTCLRPDGRTSCSAGPGSVRHRGDPNANYKSLVSRGWFVACLSEGRASNMQAQMTAEILLAENAFQ